MTTSKRIRIQKMLDHYNGYLEKLMDAQVQLISGGVQSYTIGDRTLTKFDLKKLSDEIEIVSQKIDELEAQLEGKATRKAVAVVPRDF